MAYCGAAGPGRKSEGMKRDARGAVGHHNRMSNSGHRVIVTVIGHDRVGIIARVSGLLADANANILDISQTLLQEMFTMIMMVDVSSSPVGFDELKRRLRELGTELGLAIDAQHEDVFRYMHRV
jgi:ACT domain-containing protein